MPLSAPSALGAERKGRFSSYCLPLGVGLIAPLQAVGGAADLRSSRRVTLTVKTPGVRPAPLGFTTLTGVLTPVLFRFFKFFGIRSVLCGIHLHYASVCRKFQHLMVQRKWSWCFTP